MVGIALAALHDKRTRTAAFSAERTRKMEDAAQDAQDRIKEEGEEWEHADIDEGDGGVPTAIPRPDLPTPVYHGSYKAASNNGSYRAPSNNGNHKSIASGQAPKPNAAARKAMAEREAKKAQFKAEVSAAATSWNYFEGPPPKKENPKPAPQNGGVKLGGGSEKKAVSVDELAPRFKNRLAMVDTTDDTDEGGVKL